MNGEKKLTDIAIGIGAPEEEGGKYFIQIDGLPDDRFARLLAESIKFQIDMLAKEGGLIVKPERKLILQ
jgi:hypothetical protein